MGFSSYNFRSITYAESISSGDAFTTVSNKISFHFKEHFSNSRRENNDKKKFVAELVLQIEIKTISPL